MQFPKLETVCAAKTDPGDAVAVRHGMGIAADLHQNGISSSSEDGNVLLGGTVCPVGYKFLHDLTAAVGGDSGIGKNGDDLSADVAVVKTKIHFLSSFLE